MVSIGVELCQVLWRVIKKEREIEGEILTSLECTCMISLYNRMKKRRFLLSRKVLEVSEGLLSKAVDLVLVSLFYGLEFGMGGYSKTKMAGERAAGVFSEINYATLKRAVSHLKRRGLIKSVIEGSKGPEITIQGRQRLRSTLPVYDAKRVWDKRIYLVIYDLPVSRNRLRNKLRGFLKRIGCGVLQESVWVTPYNPKRLVEEFVHNNNLDEGLVIVSSLGKDGTIGDMNLSELMGMVYNLSKLNGRYDKFLDEAKGKKLTRERAIFAYNSILIDDPQLPFELLSKDWKGDSAYFMFRRLVKLR